MNTDWEKEFDENYGSFFYPGISSPSFSSEHVKNFIRNLLTSQRAELEKEWEEHIKKAVLEETRAGRKNNWYTNGAINALSKLLQDTNTNV